MSPCVFLCVPVCILVCVYIEQNPQSLQTWPKLSQRDREFPGREGIFFYLSASTGCGHSQTMMNRSMVNPVSTCQHDTKLSAWHWADFLTCQAISVPAGQYGILCRVF